MPLCLHIWQAAMRVKGELRDRKREAKQEKEKTLGAIIPGSALAAAEFFVISICFPVPQARLQ